MIQTFFVVEVVIYWKEEEVSPCRTFNRRRLDTASGSGAGNWATASGRLPGCLAFPRIIFLPLRMGRTGLSLDKFVELCSILRVFPDYLLLGALHSDHIPQNIIDKLQLCSEEDVKLLEQIVELMVTRNQSAWTRDPDNP